MDQCDVALRRSYLEEPNLRHFLLDFFKSEGKLASLMCPLRKKP